MAWLWDFLTGTPRYQGKNCRQWAELIASPAVDQKTVEQAFRAMGPSSAGALLGLINERSSSEVKDKAAAIITSWGKEVVAQIAQAFLCHSHETTRRFCADVLEGWCQPRAAPWLAMEVEAALGNVLRHPDLPDVVRALLGALVSGSLPRPAVMRALTSIGILPIPALVGSFASKDPGMHAAAVEVLEKIARPFLRLPGAPDDDYSLSSERHFMQTLEAALGPLGRKAEPVVPILLEKLVDPDYYVQRFAEKALKLLPFDWFNMPQTQAMIPDLVRQMVLGGFYVQGPATESLDRLGPGWTRLPQVQAAVPALILQVAEASETPDRRAVLDGAIAVLDRIDPKWVRRAEARSVVPAFLDKLVTPGCYIPVVVELLDRIDPAWAERPGAKDILPALIRKAVAFGYTLDQVKPTLDRLVPEWPQSAQVHALVPWLVVKTVEVNDDERVGSRNDQDVHKAARAFLNAINPAWTQLPIARDAVPDLLLQLLHADFRSEDALATLEMIDATWTRRPEAEPLRRALINKAAEDVARIPRILDRMDPGWPQCPEARAVVPMLIRTLATGMLDDVKVGLLDRIDREWRRRREAREVLMSRPELLREDS